ncbi:MAG: HlyC/CorC family transporter [Gammaproteobacteria bacterium]|nr:HlyC/CorC family transporter [Gammaproteobacteria bacterium]MBT3473903.1 HlyC/CorC family transporter [Gammaproteobacteria bacterium]MBT4079811.1 HlyC/CorC family transporter [Gammaproteobacteria bacterium]MBT4329895.1 HlyC/CorC family transporter [Gammaproteobacteria bacterium]MBT5361573.1 HlyC/CorC family transporter [Gammaproteobacteria bacterium]
MNDIPTEVLGGILLLLILISGFFSGSETSMMAINRYRLRHLSRIGHRGARSVSTLLERPERLIGLILLGNNFVNILASSIATIIGLRLFGDAGIAIATGFLTFVVLIFAEVTPKTIAALNPERFAFPAAYLLTPLLRILYPLVRLINWITNLVLRTFGISITAEQNDHLSREELRTVVKEAGGLIPQKHQAMLTSILDLEQVTVEDIMVPRNEIIGIDIEDDWQDILNQITLSQHTRLPVFRDNTEHLLGILHMRDAIHLHATESDDKAELIKLLRDQLFIPEQTTLNTQLLQFQRLKQRMGLVVDEYGDVQGLVTLEDLLEEIVGEFTTDASDIIPEVQSREDGSYLVEGSANLRELEKNMGWELPQDGPKTLNGLILEHLEDIPESGTSMMINGYPIEVTHASENLVRRVAIFPLLRKTLL